MGGFNCEDGVRWGFVLLLVMVRFLRSLVCLSLSFVSLLTRA